MSLGMHGGSLERFNCRVGAFFTFAGSVIIWPQAVGTIELNSKSFSAVLS